ncbi:GDSL-type esterase/lipase family protein [Kovacikia minuta CCNUW1]|uniref:SGNH/GDSL hydrolase family protein n=1 Tax=Kovacikia minuta TaxID=2931930 RepID=UPI001CCF2993|nr:SGNH/GDSL hydrolase family protein [Kovacikia minuta]UBF27986.1 GDSL-type esterase/lipase family protein [Kovacikia minuta CCNUW1]
MKFHPRYRIPAIGITALVATEIFLRAAFGLGNPVLFQTDPETGYRFKPNQKSIRFSKRIEYNQYSQRSEPITAKKPEGTLRVLMIGDSVLNGGNPVDQSETITHLLEDKIVAIGQRAEVLNASASGWGIGNQLGYLQKFGTLDSDRVILLISSHNLTQPTSTGDRVGNNPFFPDQAPLFATQEAIRRYLLPMFQTAINFEQSSNSPEPVVSTGKISTSSEAEQHFQHNMELLKKSISLVKAQKVPLEVLFVPNRQNLTPAFTTPAYKLKFLQFLNAQEIPVLDVHKAWSAVPVMAGSTYFRDGKHLTEKGNEAVANFIFQQLCFTRQVKQCASPHTSATMLP